MPGCEPGDPFEEQSQPGALLFQKGDYPTESESESKVTEVIKFSARDLLAGHTGCGVFRSQAGNSSIGHSLVPQTHAAQMVTLD